MSRTRRVAVDSGTWSDPDFQGYSYEYRSFNQDGYAVVALPVALQRPDGRSETTLIAWQGGYVTFGTPSQAQIEFSRSYLAGEKAMFELPANTAGSSDFISTGMPVSAVSSVCLQNSDDGYYIAWGDPIDESSSFDPEPDNVEDCGELHLTGSAFFIDVGDDYTDGYNAYRLGTVVLDGASPIIGTNGDDRLVGRDAPDPIQGGLGADDLSGGRGRDLFIYTSVQDSPAAGGRIDVLSDFETGVDRIDLRALTVTGLQIVSLTDAFLIVADTPGGQLAIRSASIVRPGDVLLSQPLPSTGGDAYLEGTERNDRLTGGSGDDSLFGYDGNDTLEGGGGNDYLDGGSGTNILRGGEGDDYLYTSGFGGILDGGAGIDRTYLSFFGATTFTLSDDFTLFSNRYLSIERASLIGSNENDVLTGGAYDDELNGGGGSNTLNGGDGNDTFNVDADLGRFRASGIDILNGGSGVDRLNLNVRDVAVTLSLANAGDVSLGNGRSMRLNSIEAINFTGGSFGSTGYDQTITGGSGDDRFTSYGNGNDIFRGGAGNDIFNSFGGNDTFDGGDGVDRAALDFSNQGAGITYRLTNGTVATSSGMRTLIGIEAADIYGSRFADTLEGGVFDDRIEGGAGNDRVLGGSGADTLFGNDGDDQLFGGDDNDILYAGRGSDRLDGGAGIDTASFSLHDQAGSFTLAEGVTVQTSEGAATLVSIEQVDVSGSRFDDVLTGGGLNDSLSGGSGDDVLTGGLGSDTLVGGDGYDRAMFTGATNADLVSGQARGVANDVDRLSDIEWLTGSNADDRLAAGVGTIGAGAVDLVKTGAANGTIATALSLDNRFGTHRDPFVSDPALPHATVVARGGGTRDYYSFTVAAGAQAVFDIDSTLGFDSYVTLLNASGAVLDQNDDAGLDPGSAGGLDSFLRHTFTDAGTYVLEVSRYDGSGRPAVVPVDGRYVLNVSLENASLAAGSILQGNLLEGGNGSDTLVSGFGDDRLYGGAGVDTVSFERSALPVLASLAGQYSTGGGGQDRLIDIENIIGSRANDTLYGDAGGNALFGGDGDDFAAGLDGADRIEGGAGADALFGNAGSDVLLGGGGNDYLDGQEDGDFILGGDGDDRLLGGAGVDLLGGEAGNDTLSGGADADNLYGGAGNDVIFGEDGDDFADGQEDGDFILGGNGNDRLSGGAGVDLLGGEAGNDSLYGGGDGDNLYGGAGNDVILGEDGNDLIDGQEDGDFLLGGNGNDTIRGGTGVDLLGGESGDDLLFGGTGNDNMYGGSGADALFGEADADSLDGGDGTDVLGGNAGADTLVGGAGADTFLYFSTVDSDGTGGADVIRDFATGVDRIDLSGIDANATVAGNQAFTYLGISQAPGAAGTLRLGFIEGVGIFLFGNVDADPAADLIINVGTFNFAPADFAL